MSKHIPIYFISHFKKHKNPDTNIWYLVNNMTEVEYFRQIISNKIIATFNYLLSIMPYGTLTSTFPNKILFSCRELGRHTSTAASVLCTTCRHGVVLQDALLI